MWLSKRGSRIIKVFFLYLVSCCLSTACGYSIRTSKTSSLLTKNEIRTVFIHPIQNRTYRAGVENVMFNAVVRTFGGAPGFRAVSSREEADAELTATVESINRGVSGIIKASDVSPIGRGSENLLVATEYLALMNCSFSLKKSARPSGSEKVIWQGQFSRQKPFPGNNQVWSLGSTSALINESEFDRALGDVAELVARDALQSILESF